MKTSIIILLAAVVAGAAAGATIAHRQHADVPTVLGPFSPDKPMSPEEISAHYASIEPVRVGQVEVVGGNEYDFGVMLRDAQATHQFVIKNVGAGRLDLSVTGSTCKCTVGSLEKASLAPGETTVVDMEWTANTSSRVFSQSATLRTSDPEAGEVALIISGTVVDRVAAEPSSWNLGDLSAAEPIELRTTLFNYSDKPIEIVSLGWMDDEFEALSEVEHQRRPVDPALDVVHAEANEAFDISIRVAPGTPQGRLHQVLRVEYRTPGAETTHEPLEMQLTGRIVGTLSLLGGAQLAAGSDGVYRLRMGVVQPGQVREERVHILFRGPLKDTAQLRVASVEPAEALEVELMEGTERGAMRVIPMIVRTRADAPEMVRDGTQEGMTGMVTIDSEHPEVAPVRLRVVFRIGKPFGQ